MSQVCGWVGGVGVMSCYLCAYGRSDVPQRAEPLPDTNYAIDDPLGTCHVCSVWACSLHGTRYKAFECAICTPPQAVKSALGIGGDEVAARLARHAADRFVPSEDALSNLAEASVREGMIALLVSQATEALGPVRPYPVAGNNPEAAAAAIRSVFAGQRVSLQPDAPIIVSGALNLAYSLADPDNSQPPRRPPWNVTYPQLMDPLIWLIQVAVAMW